MAIINLNTGAVGDNVSVNNPKVESFDAEKPK